MTDRSASPDDSLVWSEVLRLVIGTGRWLELMISDGSVVDRAMRELLQALPLSPDQDFGDKAWHEAWEECGNELPYTLYGTTAYLRELNNFAFLGTSLDGILVAPGATLRERVAAVEEMIRACQAFVERIPKEWDGGDAPAIRRTILAAEARIRLDTGRNVSPEQLAAIAGVSLKSIRNLMTPKSGVDALRAADGQLLNEDALRWLSGRPTFRVSRWMEPDPAFNADRDSIEDLGQVIFVPAARDATWFDPVSSRRDNGFIIGPKNSEVVIEDYYDALERLARMPIPYWRRTNPSGRQTVVAGVSWLRKPVAEIETLRTGRGKS